MTATTHPQNEPSSLGDKFEPGDPACESGDLEDDPRTAAEALCLCALLWATGDAATAVTQLLNPTDFHDPSHGALFAVLAAHIGAGRPHDPASIAATLTDTGRAAGHQGHLLTRALARATAAGAAPEAAGHYALTVATAAYRRGFHTAATALTQAAQQLPTDDLFDHLLSIGRDRRTATTRLQHLRTVLELHQPSCGGVPA